MKNTLVRLDNIACFNYLKDTLHGLLFFSNAIAESTICESGSFFTIVPEGTLRKDIYNFSVGGNILPFQKEHLQNSIKEVHNLGGPYIKQALYASLKNHPHQLVCLEDFTANPSFQYFKEARRIYLLVDGGVIYLQNQDATWETFQHYYNVASGYGFLAMLTHLSSDFIFNTLRSGTELPEAVKTKLFLGMEAFAIDVYDGESNLIWISHDKGQQFLQQLKYFGL